MPTLDIARFVANLKYRHLPYRVVSKSKMIILDTLGVALAGYDDIASEAARGFALEMKGNRESTILLTDEKVPCNVASCTNAITASTLDMDDGIFGPEGHLCHPGSMVVMSALAVGEREWASGEQLIEAVTAGYEVAIRVGAIFARSSYAMAGIGGAFGSAVAAAKLMNLDSDRIVNALGIVEAHCPFPLSTSIGDTTSKRTREQLYYRHAPMSKENFGWAAMTGVSAALLAKNGFRGPISIFDMFEDDRRPLSNLGKDWEILHTYFKPYSVCRGLHTGLDGVLEIVNKNKLKPEDIASIHIGVNNVLALFNNPKPITRYEAQTSFPFAIGAVVVYGEAGPKQVDWGKLQDKAILEIAGKVKISSNARAQAAAPRLDAAEVQIETTKGKKYNTWVEYALGEPENPFNEDTLNKKFLNNSSDKLGNETANKIIEYLNMLEKSDNIRDFMSLFQGNRIFK